METLTRENQQQNGGDSHQPNETFACPRSSVSEHVEGYSLQVEMPGVSKDGLEMWVENNQLTIVGRRTATPVSGTLLHRESRRENYRRSFELDPSVNAGKISAKIDQGVVTLMLPKADEVKPRKIAVA